MGPSLPRPFPMLPVRAVEGDEDADRGEAGLLLLEKQDS
jgi:hypothetical protein